MPAVSAQPNRDHIRDETLKGRQAAVARGNHGGWVRLRGRTPVEVAITKAEEYE